MTVYLFVSKITQANTTAQIFMKKWEDGSWSNLDCIKFRECSRSLSGAKNKRRKSKI